MKKFKHFILENININRYFLRWSSSPEQDNKRNFSGNLQAWFDTKEEAFVEYNDRKKDGCYMPYPPREDNITGRWNSEPEWGLSSYNFTDEKSFNIAMNEIKEIAWFHEEDRGQKLYVFKSSDYILGDGFDGEDVFRNAEAFWHIKTDMNYDNVMSLILGDQSN